MRTARVSITSASGGTGNLPQPKTPEVVRTYDIPLPMKNLKDVPAEKVARANFSVSRLASLSYNTCSVSVGGELPCTVEELLDGTAHGVLARVCSEVLYQEFDEGLAPVFFDAVEDLEDRRSRKR